MKKKFVKTISSILCAALALSAFTGFASVKKTEAKQAKAAVSVFKPFSLTTMGVTVKYTKIPKRVVSLNQHTTENMLAMGLQNYIIGKAYPDDAILPQYKAAYDKIPLLAQKYPSYEVLLNAQPDFVFGRSSAFKDTTVASVQKLVDNGIMVYVTKETYTPNSTMEATYEDFTNLGRIFNVPDRAAKIVSGMKAKIKAVGVKTAKVNKKLNVFVYDSGTDKAFTSGSSLETNIIELAGAKNIFGDINKTWADVSWEEVVKRNPDCIIINNYGDTTANEKIKYLKNNPALASVNAIKNNKFVVLPLSDVFTGIRNADAVEYMSKQLYPELYK